MSSVLPVPDIRSDPESWFRAVDIDGDGRLSRSEVVECLKAQLPVDNQALDQALDDPRHWMWQQAPTPLSPCCEWHVPSLPLLHTTVARVSKHLLSTS